MKIRLADILDIHSERPLESSFRYRNDGKAVLAYCTKGHLMRSNDTIKYFDITNKNVTMSRPYRSWVKAGCRCIDYDCD